MKKTVSSVLAILLAVSLIFALSACRKKAEPTIIGTWVGTYDMSVFTGAEGSVKVDFKFNEDGTYQIAINEASFKAFIEDYLNSAADAAETDIDGLLAETGSTFEEYLSEAFSEVQENMNARGKYKLEGDKLYTNTDGSDEYSEEEAMHMAFGENSVTLSGEDVEVTLKTAE